MISCIIATLLATQLQSTSIYTLKLLRRGIDIHGGRALNVLGKSQGELPVLSDGRLVGVLWPQDVIERYNTELFKPDMARGMVSAVSRGTKIGVPTAEDAVVAELPVPGGFVGRTIADLNVRQDFGFSILMIKRPKPNGGEDLSVTPPADFLFRADDVMLVLGPGKDLQSFKQGRRDNER